MRNMLVYQPVRGLGREAAANYVGIGTTFFDQQVAKGTIPPALRIGNRKIWDIRDLDNYIDALKEAGNLDAPNPWDS